MSIILHSSKNGNWVSNFFSIVPEETVNFLTNSNFDKRGIRSIPERSIVSTKDSLYVSSSFTRDLVDFSNKMLVSIVLTVKNLDISCFYA